MFAFRTEGKEGKSPGDAEKNQNSIKNEAVSELRERENERTSMAGM